MESIDIKSLAAEQGWTATETSSGWEFSRDGYSFSVSGNDTEEVAGAVRKYAEEFDTNAYAEAIDEPMPVSQRLACALAKGAQLIELASSLHTSQLQAAAKTWLADHKYMYADGSGDYIEKLEPTYNDEPFSGSSLFDFLAEDRNDPDDPSPRDKFYAEVEELWDNECTDCYYSVCDQAVEFARAKLGWTDLDGVAETIVRDYIGESYVTEAPYGFYLKGPAYIAIIVDTGDANYGFTLNANHGLGEGAEDTPFEDEAGLVWLAKQQGYTKDQLEAELAKEETSIDESSFLGSMYRTVQNLPVHKASLVFYVKTTLENAMLLEALRRLSRSYDDVGHITLGKGVNCDLFDFQDDYGCGTCATFIRLDKDVELPIKDIHLVRPDTLGDHSDADVCHADPTWVYECDADALYKEELRGIHFPESLLDKVNELTPD